MLLSDLEILARTIQCEAGSEGDITMKAIACVIMNRINVDCGEYRRYRTIRDVVFGMGQLDSVKQYINGKYNPHNIFNMQPEQIHYDIAEWAMVGNKLSNFGSVLWFIRPLSSSCQLSYLSYVGKLVARINNYCFYNPTILFAET